MRAVSTRAVELPNRGMISVPLTENVVASLSEALEQIKIDDGIAQFEQFADELQSISPATPNVGSLLLQVSQWIDVGCRDARFLDPILARFCKAQRQHMAVNDYLQLRMTEAFSA